MPSIRRPALILALSFLTACGSDSSITTSPDAQGESLHDASSGDVSSTPDIASVEDTGPTGDTGDTVDTGDAGDTGDTGGPADTVSAPDTSSQQDAGETDVDESDSSTGGSAYRGRILLSESFEDDDFGSRGWYDDPRGMISTSQHVPGSGSSYECHFEVGARGCRDGTPGRLLFDESESVYLSYWVKYSENYVGSTRAYHPHEFHFITNVDDRWVGPARTHLTTYIEQVGGRARLALQDARNVDTGCILRNNDTFVGCDGDFASYAFTESRSVAACNGLVGDVDGRDCFATGGGNWYSARFWTSTEVVFRHEPGPGYKADWSFVEAYFEMNDIVDGEGIANGKLRYWLDGELLLNSDQILFRTGQHPNMRFNQFLVAPYIGDGSPVAQTMWVDELTIAQGLK